jgi:hypothetical protein
MPEAWWWIAVGVLAGMATVALLWHPLRIAAREARFSQARKDFHRQREWLEAKFIRLAASQAAPDSPRWRDCDFDDSVSYVRNRITGELCAFVAVTVALEGVGHSTGTATDLMGRLRAATAVFRFSRDRWETDGRVILNLSPSEAIRFYQNDLEIVGQEMAER